MSTHTLAHSLQTFFCKPSHACIAQWPALKSERTSVWLGLLKTDKSLTSVSGTQAAYVGHPLDIWQAERSFSSPTATSENMPPRHQTVSKSGSCWQRDTGGSCRCLMICAVHHDPSDFSCSVLLKKKKKKEREGKSLLYSKRLRAECHKNNVNGVSYCWTVSFQTHSGDPGHYKIKYRLNVFCHTMKNRIKF